MSPSENDQSEADLLKSLLAGRDIPCPVCGYNLRAIASAICPECGAKLDLRVGSTDLKLGPWLFGLLALSLSLGFVGLYVILVGMPLILGGFAVAYWSTVLALGIPLAMSFGYALLLWRLIRTRKKFWAKPRKAQYRLAILYALLGSAPVVIPVLIWLLSLLFF